MADTNGKTVFDVLSNLSCDGKGLIVEWQDDCGFDCFEHDSLKSVQFADPGGPEFLEYRRCCAVQKMQYWKDRAEGHQAQKRQLIALNSLPESERAEYKRIASAALLIAKTTKQSVASVQRMLVEHFGIPENVAMGLVPVNDDE